MKDLPPSKLIGCESCDITVQGDGSITHESHCKHQALLKIAHILKEAGITVVETAATIATSGLGAMQS